VLTTFSVLLTATVLTSSPADAATRICAGKKVTIVGTSGNDVIRGTRGHDVIDGLGGSDVINGLRGNDTICGNYGADDLRGNAGRDRLYGGMDALAGDVEQVRTGDTLRGGPGDDVLVPGYDQRQGFGLPIGVGAFADVDDVITYDTAPRGVNVNLSTQVAVGDGRDRVVVNLAADPHDFAPGTPNWRASVHLVGTRFADRLVGSVHNDEIDGRGGADRIWGAAGNDWIFAEGTRDGAAGDLAYGGPGHDQLVGRAGPDRLVGGTGDDAVRSSAEATAVALEGGEGHDEIGWAGGAGSVVDGDAGSDRLHVDAGAASTGPATWDMASGAMVLGTDRSLVTSFQHAHLNAPSAWEVLGTDEGEWVEGPIDGVVSFLGLGGNDTFTDSRGDDHFDGGEGNDNFAVSRGGTDTCTSVEVGTEKCEVVP